MKGEIKVKVEAPRIEIALGSSEAGSGPYVAVVMLHLLDNEILYQPLMPLNAPKKESQLHKQAAGEFLAEIYDYICDRWGAPGATKL